MPFLYPPGCQNANRYLFDYSMKLIYINYVYKICKFSHKSYFFFGRFIIIIATAGFFIIWIENISYPEKGFSYKIIAYTYPSTISIGHCSVHLLSRSFVFPPTLPIITQCRINENVFAAVFYFCIYFSLFVFKKQEL